MPMTLSWKKVKDYENVCEIPHESGEGKGTSVITYTLGILMPHVGYGSITEANAEEFYVRTKLVEACFGGGLMQDGKGKLVGMTPENIYSHIGLESNWGNQYVSEASFFKHLRNDVMRELHEHYRRTTQHHKDEAMVAGFGRKTGT